MCAHCSADTPPGRSSLKARAAAAAAGKRVLVLGAGYVSAPVVDYLTRDKHVHITVGEGVFKARSAASGVRNSCFVTSFPFLS